MEKLNTTSDVKKYLSSGEMTKPFYRDLKRNRFWKIA